MRNICKLFLIFSISITPLFSQNRVIHFDGINDYVNLGNSVGTGVRTIEMWFKPGVDINSQLANFSPLLVRHESPNTNEFGLTFKPSSLSNSGQLMFYIFTTSSTSYRIYSDNNSWNANQWYHVAAVIHPSQGMMLFIDGVKQNSTNTYSNATVQTSSNVRVGTWNNLINRYFNGSIDDLRISNSALYTSNFTPSCPDLIALPSTIGVWNFNNSSATLANDSSPNMNDGSIYGASSIVDEPCNQDFNVISFDGIDDFIDLGNLVGTGVRTIEMWFKPEVDITPQSTTYSPLVVRDENPNTNEFGLTFLPSFVGNSGQLLFYIYTNSSTSYRIYSDSNNWIADKWYHVAAVIHPSQGMMLFIDGIKQNSTNSYSTASIQTNSNVTICSWGNVSNRFFNGRIDDLHLSNSALYTSNFTPPCPDLAALPSSIGIWNFNDINPSKTIDSSFNANSGIIYGAVRKKDTICPIITNLTTTNKVDPEILVFPNPFTDQISFIFKDQPTINKTRRLKIFSIDGKLITEKLMNTNTVVDGSLLPSGIYFYQIIENNQSIITNKLVKE